MFRCLFFIFSFLFVGALLGQDEEVTYRVRIQASELLQDRNGKTVPGEARVRIILTDRNGDQAMTGKQVLGSFGTITFRDYEIQWPVAEVELSVEGIYWTRRIEVTKISVTMIDADDEARTRHYEGGVTLTRGNSTVRYDRAGPIDFTADMEAIAALDAEKATLDMEGEFANGAIMGDNFVIESETAATYTKNVGEREEKEGGGTRICTTTKYEASASFDVNFLTNPSSSAIYPGALITGESIADGSYVNIPAERRPITVSTDLAVFGSPSIEIEEPKLSSARRAITDLLVAQDKGDMEVQANFEIKDVYSKEQLSIALGGHFEYGASSLDFDFSYDTESEYNVKVVKFQQIYYTMDMDQPNTPFDLFKKEKDARRIMNSGEVPLVVSSITYGRVAYFFMRTEASSQEIKASLDASYNGGAVVAEGSAAMSLASILEKSETSALIIGGSGADGIQAVDGYDGFINMLRDGGKFDGSSVGKPISYTLRYLEDWKVARVNLATSYVKRTCRDVMATEETVDVVLDKLALPESSEGESEIGYDFEVTLYDTRTGETRHVLRKGNGGESKPVHFSENTSEREIKAYGSFTYELAKIDDYVMIIRTWGMEYDTSPDGDDALGNITRRVPLKEFMTAATTGMGQMTRELYYDGDKLIFYYSAKPRK